MKVALVIERMDPDRGGRERSIAQMAESMRARGLEVTILCQSSAWSAEGVTVRELGEGTGSRAARLAGFVEQVASASADGGYDMVHATLPVPGADVYQLRGGTVAGQRAAAAMRRRGPARWLAGWSAGWNPVRRLLGRLEAEVVTDRSVACLPVSRRVADELAGFYDRRENVHVVYNGVEVPLADDACRQRWRRELRQHWGAGDGETVLVTVARNPALKGVDWALRALGRVEAPARLVVVGPVSAGLKRQARRLGLSDRVVWAGELGEVHPVYAAGDVCVLLSWYDPCSRVVLEATRWAMPSITTSLNGAGEVLGDGAGIVVDRPDAVDEVASAMRLLCDANWRSEAADRCRRIAPQLTMGRHVEQVIEVYERMARSR
jgi:UDP-glucose:(heptosyl)LPS alpha-1,3-glucosyltransferase